MPSASSTATATVKGGYYPDNGVTSLASISAKGQRWQGAKLSGRQGTYYWRELVRTLIGAAAGSTATKTRTRVEANVELGGKRTIETQTLVNRATTATDVTEFKADLFSLSARTTKAAQANRNNNPLGSPSLF